MKNNWKEEVIVNVALAGLLVAIVIVWIVVQVVLTYKGVKNALLEVWKRL